MKLPTLISTRQRQLLLNRLRRQVTQTPVVSDAYWWSFQQRSPRTARLAKRAMAHPRIANAFWRYQDLRVNSRSDTGTVRRTRSRNSGTGKRPETKSG